MNSQIAHTIDTIIRVAALAAFAAALIVPLTHWAVRRQLLAPFGWWPRFVRSWSDPLLRPVERVLARGSGNPQDAPLWLLGVVLVIGLLAISGVRWLIGLVDLFRAMRGADAAAWAELAVVGLSSVLLLAIIVRVIGGWLGAGRYTRWMRPFYLLTNWLIEPIRRRLPAFGPFDLSPLLAYVLVLVIRNLLLNALEAT